MQPVKPGVSGGRVLKVASMFEANRQEVSWLPTRADDRETIVNAEVGPT